MELQAQDAVFVTRLMLQLVQLEEKKGKKMHGLMIQDGRDIVSP